MIRESEVDVVENESAGLPPESDCAYLETLHSRFCVMQTSVTHTSSSLIDVEDKRLAILVLLVQDLIEQDETIDT